MKLNTKNALTILYLKNQDLSGKSPEEITELYYSTKARISQKIDEIESKKSKEDKDHDFIALS